MEAVRTFNSEVTYGEELFSAYKTPDLLPDKPSAITDSNLILDFSCSDLALIGFAFALACIGTESFFIQSFIIIDIV